MQNDFPDDLLEHVDHRPWPVPDAPWVMTQSWHDLLFLNWPIDAGMVRSKLPDGLDLDLYDNTAWLGITPFHMTNVSPRGLPALPWVSAFPELNVRTYVRRKGRPGIYFFSLDAGNSLAVGAARALLNLPYYTAEIEVDTSGTQIRYRSRRTSAGETQAAFSAEYGPTGPVRHAAAGSLEHFLTERYCLHAIDHTFHAYTIEIHHPPWRLQPAEATITENTMADVAGLRLPKTAPLLHFSKRQDTLIWPPE